ncbi:hypothetical protein [Viridibacillus arvi]|uniref:hypothetical protein n=1 Tax=Viridibacillus arvi TaxID=263475 RepID=UPI003D2A028B
MTLTEIVSYPDDSGRDILDELYATLYEKDKYDTAYKRHLQFIIKAVEKVSQSKLSDISDQDTSLTLEIDGQQYTETYTIVKALRKQPIYELRCKFNNNEHLRLLFFEHYFSGTRYIIFTKIFTKSWDPPSDETDVLRDASYEIYKMIRQNPAEYLGEDE